MSAEPIIIAGRPTRVTGSASAPDAREVRKCRVTFVALLLAGLCGVLVLHRFDPTRHSGEAHFYPRCLLHEYTGLYCPGCGTTRALHALVHGRVATAVRFNPLIVLLGIPAVGWGFIRLGVRAAFPRVRLRELRNLPVSRAMGIVVILFSVLRNVPYRPFTYLAPPEGASEPSVSDK